MLGNIIRLLHGASDAVIVQQHAVLACARYIIPISQLHNFKSNYMNAPYHRHYGRTVRINFSLVESGDIVEGYRYATGRLYCPCRVGKNSSLSLWRERKCRWCLHRQGCRNPRVSIAKFRCDMLCAHSPAIPMVLISAVHIRLQFRNVLSATVMPIYIG